MGCSGCCCVCELFILRGGKDMGKGEAVKTTRSSKIEEVEEAGFGLLLVKTPPPRIRGECAHCLSC